MKHRGFKCEAVLFWNYHGQLRCAVALEDDGSMTIEPSNPNHSAKLHSIFNECWPASCHTVEQMTARERDYVFDLMKEICHRLPKNLDGFTSMAQTADKTARLFIYIPHREAPSCETTQPSKELRIS